MYAHVVTVQKVPSLDIRLSVMSHMTQVFAEEEITTTQYSEPNAIPLEAIHLNALEKRLVSPINVFVQMRELPSR